MYGSFVNLVEKINTGPYTWRAKLDSRFEGLSLAEIKEGGANPSPKAN